MPTVPHSLPWGQGEGEVHTHGIGKSREEGKRQEMGLTGGQATFLSAPRVFSNVLLMRSCMEVGTRLSPAGLKEVCTLCLATNKLIGKEEKTIACAF